MPLWNLLAKTCRLDSPSAEPPQAALCWLNARKTTLGGGHFQAGHTQKGQKAGCPGHGILAAPKL